MRTLVTGGAGFIGSNTVELFLACGEDVFVVDNYSTGRTLNLNSPKMENVKFPNLNFPKKPSMYSHVVDITEYDELEICFKQFKPEAVLHLAAQSAITTSNQRPGDDLNINALGTLNVVRLCKQYGVERLVFSSTSAVYKETRSPLFGMKESFPKEPQSPYGISKLAAEHYVRTMFPNHLIFRYGNVYGPKQVAVGENQVVARAFDHFLNSADFKVNGDGRQTRDFIYVGDVAMANMLALYPGGRIGTYNLATGVSRSVNEVVEEVQATCRKFWKNIEHTEDQDPRGSVRINNSKFKKEVKGLKFTSLRTGIKKTADWWMEKK
jgi:UDP-glucose 4-epimerase